MKRKLTKPEYEKLSEDMKKLYGEKDGNYFLDLEDDDDFTAQRAATVREREARRTAEKTAQELQDKLDALADDKSKKSGDVESLTKSYDLKIAKIESDNAAKLAQRDNFIKSTLVDSVAQSLAAKISTVPSVMARMIKDRLSVDFEGDAPATRVLGSDGKISASTLADLEKEFVANKEYAGIIIASKGSGANGSAANGGKTGSNGGDAPKPPVDKPLSSYTPREMVAYVAAKKEAEANAT